MRSLLFALGLGTAALTAGEASASVTIIGETTAAACARLFSAQRSDEEAIDTCTTALAVTTLSQRDRVAVLVDRGAMYMQRRDWRRAIDDFDAAIKLDDKIGEAWVDRGSAYLGLKRPKEAVEQITTGLQLGSGAPEKGYYNRAVAYELLDDEKSAYLDFLKASELAPDWSDAKRALARFTVKPQPHP